MLKTVPVSNNAAFYDGVVVSKEDLRFIREHVLSIMQEPLYDVLRIAGYSSAAKTWMKHWQEIGTMIHDMKENRPSWWEPLEEVRVLCGKIGAKAFCLVESHGSLFLGTSPSKTTIQVIQNEISKYQQPGVTQAEGLYALLLQNTFADVM